MNSQRNSLSKIPGQYIVDAMDQLPPCGPESTNQQLGVDVPLWGRFQVTFRPFRHAPGGRSPSWIWLAKTARPLNIHPQVSAVTTR